MLAALGPDRMSKWQDQKAEINRRALARLTKALPVIFPPGVLGRALGRPFIPPTPRLAILECPQRTGAVVATAAGPSLRANGRPPLEECRSGPSRAALPCLE